MRTVVLRFPSVALLRSALLAAREQHQLQLTVDHPVKDGEWILAMLQTDDAPDSASAAAKATKAGTGTILTFEPRDWSRLIEFAEPAPHTLPLPIALPDLDGPTEVDERPTLVSSESTASAPAAAASVSVVSVPASSIVMLVEDDPEAREMISVMLETIGLCVRSVENGEAALDQMKRERPHIAVVDWNLPGISGLQLCRAIRQHPDLSDLPVLFLTGNSSSQDMIEAFASGADDFVTKPFRAPELGARIFALLRRSRMSGQPPR